MLKKMGDLATQRDATKILVRHRGDGVLETALQCNLAELDKVTLAGITRSMPANQAPEDIAIPRYPLSAMA
ncbi:MAG: hypothetical protein Q8K34_14260 [Hydrogenophaga sp.]|uniref:hypothetical protein n=1 Tax=Hydrogenophaga sp. TaxID=1904254 RepID=UPI002736A9AA|nr:hypothetical protein [Hydrogenophaga sp.]MDP2096352.1 hypothetical protein [Hydrogenophaga sp.]MDP2221345.1 hypothetical protein [Hydrogenophaga sp.]MDP3343532.1 hypothetical protein [Hydrogenophaga sp.]MDP3808977.1 hypothetical protein [Hydrogenophaga sp.]MDP3925550.1 hypothetical protein [Hydrogenophaga sp.]